MTDLRLYNRTFLRDFIRMYRDRSVLWDKNDELYLSESARFSAYADLQEKLLEVDKDATIETVRTKIGNMRANFRYEMKKVEAGKELGKPYIPKLWYFTELIFLTDKEIPKFVLENFLPIKYEDVDTTSIRLCNKKFIKEFINLYKNYECLWKIQSPDYKNRKLKLKALENLRKMYSQCDKNITIDIVKKKINALRAGFRHELKKIRNAENKGESYKPLLYYFNDLIFLKDIESDRYGFKEFEPYFNNFSENSDFKEFENINYENFLKQSVENKTENNVIEEIEIMEIDDDIIEHIEPTKNISIEILNSDNTEEDTTQDLYEFENVNDFEQSESEDEIKSISLEQNGQNSSRELEINSTEIKTVESPKEFKIIEKFEENDEKPSKYNSLNFSVKGEDCNAYANYVISELKMLSADERIFVKKIFSDVLFEAKLGNAKCTKLISNTTFQKQLNK